MLDLSALDLAVSQLVEHAGGLDMLIANAGVFGPRVSFKDSDPTDWEEALLVNTLGLSRSCRACIPALASSGKGQVLVIGSAIGHGHSVNCSAYALSKAMAWSLVKCLSLELAPFGIAVNELIPGPVNTSMNPGGMSSPACREPDNPAFLELVTYLWSLKKQCPSGQSFSLRAAP
jgi:3-oxoacyl-[acyl-carrier protein] reductase